MILYITRKYPPSIGGMQTMSFELFRALNRYREVTLFAHNGSVLKLLAFLARIPLQLALLAKSPKPPRILLIGDAALSPMVYFARQFLPKAKVVGVLHGLDITYSNRFYQKLIVPSLKRLDAAVCISQGTKEIAVSLGLDESRLTVIHPGVSSERLRLITKEDGRLELRDIHGVRIDDRPVLLYVGRLVPRKGVLWFTEHVLPVVKERFPSVLFITVGTGKLQKQLEELIKRKNLEENTLVAGHVNDVRLATYYRSADLFIMPNRVQQGDIEGFGLVALEAALNGLWTVATDVMGVREAVVDEETGVLVPPEDPVRFADEVIRQLDDLKELQKRGSQAALYTGQYRSWDETAKGFFRLFDALLKR